MRTASPGRGFAMNRAVMLEASQDEMAEFTAALQTLEAGRAMSHAFAVASKEKDHLSLARSFAHRLVTAWWRALTKEDSERFPIRPVLSPFKMVPLPKSASALADSLGSAAAILDPESAAYHIGLTYTGMLPIEFRSTYGIYYTPPALTARLISHATDAGVDWTRARILDPACGGGAFLTPVAQRIIDSLPGKQAKSVLKSISTRLQGFELDPFGAWLSQISLDAVVLPLSYKTGSQLPVLVSVCDSLKRTPSTDLFDLIIGNPPYGRVKLDPTERTKYKNSLYGHANLYGLFTDMAVQNTKECGVIAYVTPTSFLAGEYFKNLRLLLGQSAPPISFDFITARKGVFDEVLQETLLAIYRRAGERQAIKVNQVTPSAQSLVIKSVGKVALPLDLSSPWVLPRDPDQTILVNKLNSMSYRLSDWGYAVSTGPLVWNRYKDQLAHKSGKNCYPLIWSEALTQDGEFIFRAEKRNHAPFFHLSARDKSLLINKSCVLLQRTTAKEQARRLIAAVLPQAFLDKHRAVVVENHLNMLRPTITSPAVSVEVLAAFLNSSIVDRAFRCLSGSVAVSAFELESLPLPHPATLTPLQRLVEQGGTKEQIDIVCDSLYREQRR